MLLEKEITPRSRYVQSTRSYDSYEQTIVYAVADRVKYSEIGELETDFVAIYNTAKS